MYRSRNGRPPYNEHGGLYKYDDEDMYWYTPLSNVCSHKILYQVNAYSSDIGCHRVIYGGDVTVHAEQTVGDWSVIEFTADFSQDSPKSGIYGEDNLINYIVAFDTKRGLELHVSGLLSLEELEKIADGLTLKVTETERPHQSCRRSLS